MKTQTRILVCAIAMPVVMIHCAVFGEAGEFFRERLSPSFLDRSQDASLPAVVTRAQSPSYDDDSAQYVTQASEEAVSYYDDKCSTQGCNDPSCQACQNCEKENWLDAKCRCLKRKAYFNHHRNHKQFLYPVCRPYCQPGFGIYDTCWRRIQPNYCACQNQQYLYSQPDAVPQAPAGAPNGQGQNPPSYDNTPPTPYQR